MGKRSDPSHSLGFQLPPCFLVPMLSKKLFMCALTSVPNVSRGGPRGPAAEMIVFQSQPCAPKFPKACETTAN